MERIIVFSGAGMSAESGLKTFRDADGLWEEYDIEEVATPEAWKANPGLVLQFYNMRRKQVLEARPNHAHKALKELEANFEVIIITQNIDDLHERAGSSSVMHLHGEILKAKSEKDSAVSQRIEKDLKLGDLATDKGQLRPDVVWFGEPVPMYQKASEIMPTATQLIIVGTSLNVYPAAGLVYLVKPDTPVYLVDPAEMENPGFSNFKHIKKKASEGIPDLVQQLLNTTVGV